MTNYWVVSQGASNMSRSQAPCDEILFSVLLFCKIIPSQKSVTLTHKNKLFAWGGCKNAQVVQKRALEWMLGLFPFIHTASPLQLHKVLLGDLYSSLHLWSDLWPVFCTCHLKLADTNKASVIVCLPELSQSGEKTREKNKSSCLEELRYQNVLQKATCASVNSSAHKLNQYYFTLWASWFFLGGREGTNTEQNFIQGGGSVP